MDRPHKAKANPTKAFFVRMVTRDISLEDCILDLTDNSVDGAWQMEGGKPMSLSSRTVLSKYKIDVELSAAHFQISDNCGGISLDQAAEYAFTFGRRDTDPHEKYSIGVYGIGMKRAVFKIGNQIRIRSNYRLKLGKTESFAVPINVADWLSDQTEQWDFDIESDKPLPAPGVKISISNLNEGASTAFGSPAFVQKLKRTIARDYALHLHRGLVIVLNGEIIKGWQIVMRKSAKFEPLRTSYIDKEESRPVSVEILAGMAALPPESSDPDESDQDEDRSGWYVACNGRIVLAADKSIVAGWGSDGWPKWHPQYSGFIGLILFVAEDAAYLPLTTTKRSVDTSSPATTNSTAPRPCSQRSKSPPEESLPPIPSAAAVSSSSAS
jgi:hypothetical protein